jgi:propionaldehyde dehydrogenase
MIHSTNIHNMSRAASRMNTTIFVKNAPSYAGLGYNGQGYATLTIATPTGEGLTSARSFTRLRRCYLSGDFRIV